MSEQLEIWKAAATSFRELCLCPTLPVECQLLSLGCFVDGLMMGYRSWQFQKYVNWIDIAFLHSAFLRLLLRWIYKIFFCAEECYFLNTAAVQKYLCSLLPSSMIKNRCRKLFCCFRAAQLSLYIQAENSEIRRIILLICECNGSPIFQLESFTKANKVARGCEHHSNPLIFPVFPVLLVIPC